jgi:hypothetical protein
MKRNIIRTVLFLAGFSLYAQAITLDDAINNASVSLQNRLNAGSVIAILNISSPYERISDYILKELEMIIAGNGVLTVVSRNQLDIVRNEMALQYSGEISDESAQSLGRFLGAQYIISGSFERIGDVYRLRIWAINVENASLTAPFTANIPQNDRLVLSLTDAPVPGTRAQTQTRNTEPGNGLDNSKWFSVGASGGIGGFIPGFTGMIGDMYDEEFFGGMQANLTFYEHYRTYGEFFWLPNAFFVEISNMFLWVRPYEPVVGGNNNYTNDQTNFSPMLGLGALWNIRLGEPQKWITHFGLSFNYATPDFYFKYEYEDMGETHINGGLFHSLVYFVGIHGGIRYRFTDFISAELTAKYLIALNDPSPPTGFFDGRQPKEPIKVNYSHIQMFLGIRLSIPYSVFSR